MCHKVTNAINWDVTDPVPQGIAKGIVDEIQIKKINQTRFYQTSPFYRPDFHKLSKTKHSVEYLS